MKKLKIVYIILFFVNFFSPNLYYQFGYITSFNSFLFCFLIWNNLALLLAISTSLFVSSEKLNTFIKTFGLISIFSLIYINTYTQIDDSVLPYYDINKLLPSIIIDVSFLFKVIIGFIISFITLKKDNYKINYKYLKYSFFIFLLVIPLNIFQNIENILSSNVYSFLEFKNFNIFHLLSILIVIILTKLIYNYLKTKDNKTKEAILCLLAISMLIEGTSKVSIILGDGYNLKYSILEAIPLFICNIGIYVCALAILTKNKLLREICLFVHAAGAVSVFAYTGSSDLSDFRTIFSYNFLYFVVAHAVLFILCVMPYFLRLNTFKLKKSIIPMIYYCIIIVSAAGFSALVSSLEVLNLQTQELVHIIPNFAFTQVSPIDVNIYEISFTFLGYEFNLLYLFLLYLVYIAIFLTHYLIFRLVMNKIEKNIVL